MPGESIGDAISNGYTNITVSGTCTENLLFFEVRITSLPEADRIQQQKLWMPLVVQKTPSLWVHHAD